MQFLQILYIAFIFWALFFTSMSYAIYLNIANLGKYLRTSGFLISTLSVIFSLLTAAIDMPSGLLTGMFSLMGFVVIAAHLSGMKKGMKNGTIKAIRLYPGKFQFIPKDYGPVMHPLVTSFILTSDIAKVSTIIVTDDEKDPILVPQFTPMENDAEYELMCRHTQKEDGKSYWLCSQMSVLKRPFSIKRMLFQIFAYFVMAIGIFSVSVQGGVNVMGLSMDPQLYNYISGFFGGAVGIGLGYAGRNIYCTMPVGRVLCALLYYVSLALFILHLFMI